MNNNIIGTFIRCMAKTRINKWAMVRLYLNIFYSTWCQDIIEAIMSLHENLRVPLLEMYMNHPPWSLSMENILRRPTLIIRDHSIFNRVWPKMESYFHFLLHWRKITIGLDYEWLTNYLSLFKAYVHPVVDFDNLEMLDFCTPNIEKSS